MNRLYFGNNLPVLSQHVGDESVDLVYLDPPFNSNAQYNVLYETTASQKDTAQRSVFHDSWHWEEEAQACFNFVLAHGGPTAAILNALRSALGLSDTMAYLAMMTARLLELHRVMKPNASLYLHCDPTASHYLKIILDSVFGADKFRNEVIWKRTSAHSNATVRLASVHDVILVYSKGDKVTWNQQFAPYSDEYIAEHFVHTDPDGRVFRRSDLVNPAVRPNLRYDYQASNGRVYKPHPNGWKVSLEVMQQLDRENRLFFPQKEDARLRKKIYLDESPGVPISDIWDDLPPIHASSRERIGYPTQKPVALLKRIIEASSNPGDVVLDPFCGCGTTVYAATELRRSWIGIDVSYYGIRLIQRRLTANFGPRLEVDVQGIPADLAGAEALAESAPYAFQQWAVDELGCQMWNGGKKGADGGIDGEMWFFAGPGAPGRLLVQVKAGKKTTVQPVREFRRVMDRENAQVGVFVTRSNPTAEMRQEAADAGVFRIGSASYPRMQLVGMEAWFNGRRPHLPTPIPLEIPQDRSRPKAAKRPDPRQPQLRFVFHGDGLKIPTGQVLNPALLPVESLKADVA